MRFPLPFTAGHCVWSSAGKDSHNNDISTWAAPVDVPAVWWSPSSTEPNLAGQDRTIVDVVLVVSSTLVVSPYDRMVVGGKLFEVIGQPEDFDHGPWARPGRKPVALRRVEG